MSTPHDIPFLRLLRTRRSVRRYRNRPIPRAILRRLQEAVLRAPSSRGLAPWELVFVTERSLLRLLSKAKPHGASFLAGAALGIVVCGDPRRADTWIEDCAIAAYTAHLAAHALKLGSCWIQLRMRPHDASASAEAYVRRLLGLPRTLRVLAIVAVGVPAARPKGVPAASLPWEKIHLVAGLGTRTPRR
jgi:nitroreductase